MASCTRIYISMDTEKLFEKLCSLDVHDLGKGYYTAKSIFKVPSKAYFFKDTESEFDEVEIQELVKRIADIVGKRGVILADTFSYDYDPMPEVCYYANGEFVAKMLNCDGGEFQGSHDITNILEWTAYVNAAEEFSY